MNYKIIDKNHKNYPVLLKIIENPPERLYAMGDTTLLNEPCFAIIGSRSCTEKGIEIATNIAKELCNYNFCIVSGMAIGIDTAAHSGALLAGGKTIAVLGTGFNHIYPEENINLPKKIVDAGGLVISEFPPNTGINPTNFPKRNRIVSGLSIGVLVVEAHHRSGTTITAGLAKRQGRKVFAIPNTIDNKYGIITNELIKKGAILTRSAEDIAIEYGLLKKGQVQKSVEVLVPEEYKEIYRVLSDEKTNIEEIAKKLDEPISAINATLTLMELEGYAKRLPGEFYVRR